MAIYRKEWTDTKGTGWQYRLDIVPYDETLSGSVTTLSNATANLIEVGAVESSLDELPYGLESPKQMTVKMALSKLPTALRTYIRTKQSGAARNLFMYWSDRGTGSYTLEFAGVQARIAGTSYVREAGATMTSVELIDALQWVMSNTTMDEVFTDAAWAYSGTRNGVLYDVGFSGESRADAYHDARVSATGWSDGFYTASWETLVHAVRKGITANFTAKAARTANVGLAATEQAVDINDFWMSFVETTSIFYKATTSTPRNVSTALDSTTLLLVSDIVNSDFTQVIGGMTAAQDKYAWANYESAWDWLKDICETFNAKATYTMTYNAGVGSPYLSASWEVTAPKAPHFAAVVPSLDLSKRLNEPEVTETEVGIGKVEVRWESESDNDRTEAVINTGAARADRSFNVVPVMHNLPTYKADYRVAVDDTSKADLVSKGLFQTNLLCYLDGSAIIKAHEAVRLYSDATTSTLFTPSESDTPPNPAVSDAAPQEWGLWCNSVQADATNNGGLPRALASHLSTLFGSDDLAKLEVEWRITDYPSDVLNDNLGMVHTLTGDLATDLPHLNWTTACVVGIKADHAQNKATVTYILVP